MDLSDLDNRYLNDENGAPAYDLPCLIESRSISLLQRGHFE